MQNLRPIFTHAGAALLFLAILGFCFFQFGGASKIDTEARGYLKANFSIFLDPQNGWYSAGLWARASDGFRNEWPPKKLLVYFQEMEGKLGQFRAITAINRGTGGVRDTTTEYRMDYDVECVFARGHAIVSVGIARQSARWAFDRILITPEISPL